MYRNSKKKIKICRLVHAQIKNIRLLSTCSSNHYLFQRMRKQRRMKQNKTFKTYSSLILINFEWLLTILVLAKRFQNFNIEFDS